MLPKLESDMSNALSKCLMDWLTAWSCPTGAAVMSRISCRIMRLGLAGLPSPRLPRTFVRRLSQRMKVLFCGEHMRAGFEFSRDILASEPDIEVRACSRERLPEEAIDAAVLVPLMSRVSRELLVSARRLRLVMQFGVGLEGVDLEAAAELGVPVANIPSLSSGNAQSCAEHAVFLAISLLRDVHGMRQAFLTGGLGTPTGRTLFGATTLIYGFGDLGRCLSTR